MRQGLSWVERTMMNLRGKRILYVTGLLALYLVLGLICWIDGILKANPDPYVSFTSMLFIFVASASLWCANMYMSTGRQREAAVSAGIYLLAVLVTYFCFGRNTLDLILMIQTALLFANIFISRTGHDLEIFLINLLIDAVVLVYYMTTFAWTWRFGLLYGLFTLSSCLSPSLAITIGVLHREA